MLEQEQEKVNTEQVTQEQANTEQVNTEHVNQEQVNTEQNNTEQKKKKESINSDHRFGLEMLEQEKVNTEQVNTEQERKLEQEQQEWEQKQVIQENMEQLRLEQEQVNKVVKENMEHLGLEQERKLEMEHTQEQERKQQEREQEHNHLTDSAAEFAFSEASSAFSEASSGTALQLEYAITRFEKNFAALKNPSDATLPVVSTMALNHFCPSFSHKLKSVLVAAATLTGNQRKEIRVQDNPTRKSAFDTGPLYELPPGIIETRNGTVSVSTFVNSVLSRVAYVSDTPIQFEQCKHVYYFLHGSGHIDWPGFQLLIKTIWSKVTSKTHLISRFTSASKTQFLRWNSRPIRWRKTFSSTLVSGKDLLMS